MWEISDGPKTVSATRKLIREFVEMLPCPDDRPLQERRLEFHRENLRAGSFRSPEWASAYCVETQKTYRINGKHTSIVLQDWDDPDYHKIVLTRYTCPTLRDVAALYATYDARESSRTHKDIYTVFARTHAALSDLPKNYIAQAIAGMAWAIWGHEAKRKSASERAQLALTNPQFVVFVAETIAGVEGRHLNRAGVVAAMYKTWSKNKGDSAQFWRMVRTGEAADPNHASRVLQRWLLTATAGRHASSTSRSERSAGAREFMARCIHGWNAFRKNESTRLQYFAKADLPDVA
jgi:hypothetical protein